MKDPKSKGGEARAAKLSAKERRDIASKAARARWSGATMNKRRKTNRQRQRNTFGDALVQAQQQLAEAQNQLNYHHYEYNRLKVEIPNLMRTVQALQQLQGQPQVPQYPGAQIAYYPQPSQPNGAQPLPLNYSLDTIMSDAPLIPGDPSMTFVMPPAPPSIPPAHPPTPSMVEMPKPPLPPRGGGGAVGKPIEDEDEDLHLKNSGLPGGEWK